MNSDVHVTLTIHLFITSMIDITLNFGLSKVSFRVAHNWRTRL